MCLTSAQTTKKAPSCSRTTDPEKSLQSGHQHGFRLQHRLWTSARPSVATCANTDPDTVRPRPRHVPWWHHYGLRWHCRLPPLRVVAQPTNFNMASGSSVGQGPPLDVHWQHRPRTSPQTRALSGLWTQTLPWSQKAVRATHIRMGPGAAWPMVICMASGHSTGHQHPHVVK